MHRQIRRLVLPLLLLLATHAHADRHFVVSPSVGTSSVSNIQGYKNAVFVRVDGSYYPVPVFGINVFGAGYENFKSSGSGHAISIKMSGYGVGVIGKWPVHERVHPYIRADYMLWKAEVSALGKSPLASDSGGSAGLAIGAQFPIWNRIGVKAEVSGYNKVSDANLRQFSVGLTVEF